MTEYTFDDDTVEALLRDSLDVIRTENLSWQTEAPEELRDFVVATVVPNRLLAGVFEARTSGREATWMVAQAHDRRIWAILGLTFVDESAVRLAFEFSLHREHLMQVAEGAHLFLVSASDRDSSQTSADVIESSTLIYQGGSDALRRGLTNF